MNFLRDPKTAIHHIAFEVRDWSDMKRASDMLAKNDIKLAWRPLRHIIGHNIAIYHNNPDGVTIEFFCELDQMHDEELGFFEPRPWHQDRPQRPGGLGRRHAVELVGADVAQPRPEPERAGQTGRRVRCQSPRNPSTSLNASTCRDESKIPPRSEFTPLKDWKLEEFVRPEKPRARRKAWKNGQDALDETTAPAWHRAQFVGE